MIRASADSAYRNVKMSRSLKLSGAKLTDLFVCQSPEEHRYDYVLLFNTRPELSAKAGESVTFSETPYNCIRNASRYVFDSDFRITVDGTEVRMRVSVPVEVFVGEASGIPPTNPGVRTVSGSEKRPVLTSYPVIIRAKEKSVTFEAQWKIR